LFDRSLYSTLERHLAQGLDPNSRDEHDMPLLHAAACSGNAEACQVLLKAANIEINAQDSAGRTPLQCAASNHSKEVAMLLAEAGADSKGIDVNAIVDKSDLPVDEAADDEIAGTSDSKEPRKRAPFLGDTQKRSSLALFKKLPNQQDEDSIETNKRIPLRLEVIRHVCSYIQDNCMYQSILRLLVDRLVTDPTHTHTHTLSLSLSLSLYTVLDEPGLFRLSGMKNEVIALHNKFDQGTVQASIAIACTIISARADLSTATDVADIDLAEFPIHVITGALKHHIREQTNPLVPFHLYNSFMDAYGMMSCHECRSSGV
jgi:hypothetical protein